MSHTIYQEQRHSADGGRTKFTPYAEVRETHSAVVIFLGDRAYKVKKPVDLGFLNFSSREQRLEACENEVRLNRRLSPDVYLGIADVTDVDLSALDHLVVMRRLPAERRLAGLVRSKEDVTDEVRRLAHMIAAFHTRCARNPAIAANGTRDALATRWTANLGQVRRLQTGIIDRQQLDEVAGLVERYLEGRDALFVDRVLKGSIVDGHGDLLAEDIFLTRDGPRILDCIEFSDNLRYVDQLDDAAFLAMDLERLGNADLASRFMAWYLEFTGDAAPPSLVHHFIAYRAFVRAEVACLREAQGATKAASDARQHLHLAHAHLQDGAVRLILVGGSPGTGKTTVASGLADELGFTMLSSDRLRKELAGVGENASMSAAYGQGHYTPEWTERTYVEMLRRAELLLSMGESVVLDATWSQEKWRRGARDLAQHTSSDIHELRCELPTELVFQRITGRVGISDANSEIAGEVGRRFAAWPESASIDTRLDPAQNLMAARRVVAPPRVGGFGARPTIRPD